MPLSSCKEIISTKFLIPHYVHIFFLISQWPSSFVLLQNVLRSGHYNLMEMIPVIYESQFQSCYVPYNIATWTKVQIYIILIGMMTWKNITITYKVQIYNYIESKFHPPYLSFESWVQSNSSNLMLLFCIHRALVSLGGHDSFFHRRIKTILS